MKEFMDKLFDQMEARSEPKEGNILRRMGCCIARSAIPLSSAGA